MSAHHIPNLFLFFEYILIVFDHFLVSDCIKIGSKKLNLRIVQFCPAHHFVLKYLFDYLRCQSSCLVINYYFFMCIIYFDFVLQNSIFLMKMFKSFVILLVQRKCYKRQIKKIKKNNKFAYEIPKFEKSTHTTGHPFICNCIKFKVSTLPIM